MIPHITLDAMTFDPDSLPENVVLTVPAATLYALARTIAAVGPGALTESARVHLFELYDFVNREIADRYFDAGLDETAPVRDENKIMIPVTITAEERERTELATFVAGILIGLAKEEDATPTRGRIDSMAARIAVDLLLNGWRRSSRLGDPPWPSRG
jgi:hypothetical protein